MPHLIVEHTARLLQTHDMQALADRLRDVAVETGVFPLAGVRVRLHAADVEAVADGHPDNAYVAILLRIGAGRDTATRRSAGQALFDAAQRFFETEIAGGHFMISLDIQVNDPEVSFKANSIRDRLSDDSGS